MSAETKRPGRVNAAEKAKRLLTSGRLRVLQVEGNLIVAECRGDSGEVYQLGYQPDFERWGCTCPARTACSHMQALWSVTAVER
ncbi:MAG: hypothetical protein H0W31_00080 [Actinobacteria bacterium]|nr:hypothetical protein [Actinomycetota bacterium]